MAMDTLRTGTAGLLFGAALASSGVWSPEVIITQMQLQDFHMVKVFLTASAISAVILPFFERTGLLRCRAKDSSSYGWLGRYD
ncbi:hypothetical protein K432DRAFT_400810 [Lepidopterella palustris CBS 459.81]|uniref:Uncharacterized protein n=1 Tax=Lepidopterella palustris CBS 459.81 TaxID=1314670 RepID=A0A8E2EIZ1_9PEZI|nr:hypothetical protein K432DRAFT_400810 [Lepidopterella palustris CBS 459.81]